MLHHNRLRLCVWVLESYASLLLADRVLLRKTSRSGRPNKCQGACPPGICLLYLIGTEKCYTTTTGGSGVEILIRLVTSNARSAYHVRRTYHAPVHRLAAGEYNEKAHL